MFLLCHASMFHTIILHPIGSLRFLLLHDKRNIVVNCFFIVESPHKSLLQLIILLLSSFSFSLLLLPPLLFLSVFPRHSGMSQSTLLYLSRPPPLPFRPSFFLCCLQCFPFFKSHACWEVSVNISELVSGASFAGASVGLLVSLCCCLHLTTHSLTFCDDAQ